jgi:Mg-chelatase subunit ChlD
MNAWKSITGFVRQLDRLLDTPIPSLATTFEENLLSDRPSRTVDVLAIDISHSMGLTDYEPSRLGGAVRAASQFLKRRVESDPDALVGIVTFCWRARVVASPRPVSANLPATLQALEDLSTGNATNLAAGLSLARREIKEIAGVRQPKILLLTDGHPTMGDNPVEIAALIKEDSIQLDIIGIGGSPEDVNEPVLKEMASEINGQRRYWFITSVGELVQKFEALALREFP